jgi:hypothetical protein
MVEIVLLAPRRQPSECGSPTAAFLPAIWGQGGSLSAALQRLANARGEIGETGTTVLFLLAPGRQPSECGSQAAAFLSGSPRARRQSNCRTPKAR